MTALLDRRPTLVFLLLAIYFAINVVLRTALPGSLELDEAEQIFLSQWLVLGYGAQPPFYNWLQYGVISLFGVSVFSLSVLKNVMLLASYGLLGLTAFAMIRDRRLAVIATLALITIPQIGYGAQRDLTHTIALIFATALFVFALSQALRRPSANAYLVTGVAIGLGTISKYNFVILPAAVFLAMMSDRDLRRHVLDWRILLTAAAALVVVLPHAAWFLDNLGTATDRTLEKMTVDATGGPAAQIANSLWSLVVAVAGFAGPTVALFAILFGRNFRVAMRSGNAWTRLVERSWLIGIVLLVLLAILLGGVDVRDRWLTPLFLMLPLYLGVKLDLAGASSLEPMRQVLIVALAVMIIVPGVLVARVVAATWIGEYQKLNVPYGPMVERLVDEASMRPGLVLAGDTQLGGSIRLHAPDLVVTAPDYAWLPQPASIDQPILVVWRDLDRSPEPPQAMPEPLSDLVASRTPQNYEPGEQGIARLPYHYGADGDDYGFAYLWLMPARER